MGQMKEWALRDDGFTGFLGEIVASGGLEGSALGITRKVISEGRDVLSPKQEYVFRTEVLQEYHRKECKSCDNNIPWGEMFEAYHNGGYCSW